MNNDIIIPDARFDVVASTCFNQRRQSYYCHSKIRVSIQLDSDILASSKNNSNIVVDVVAAANQLQRSVGRLCAMAAAKVATESNESDKDEQEQHSDEIHIKIHAAKMKLALPPAPVLATEFVLDVDFTKWLAFFPSVKPQRNSNSHSTIIIETIARELDFLANVAAPDLTRIVLRVLSASGRSSSSFMPLSRLAATVLNDGSDDNIETAAVATRADSWIFSSSSSSVFAAAARTVFFLLLVFHPEEELASYFCQQREQLIAASRANLMDLHRSLNTTAAIEIAMTQTIPTQFEAGGTQIGVQFTEDLLAGSSATTTRRRARVDEEVNNSSSGFLLHSNSVLSGFGRPSMEHTLRRRSAAVFIWSSMQRVLLPRGMQLAPHSASASSSSSMFLQLFLSLVARTNNSSSIITLIPAMSGIASDTELEASWTEVCSSLNRAAFSTFPASTTTSPPSSSPLWWRRPQLVIMSLSLDLERRTDDMNDESSSASSLIPPAISGLSARIDCCSCIDPLFSSSSSSSAAAEVDSAVQQFLAKRSAQAQQLPQTSNMSNDGVAVAFSFPLLLLHVAFIAPTAAFPKQRIFLCIYSAFGSCGCTPLSFNEEAATIVAAKHVKPIEVFEFTAPEALEAEQLLLMYQHQQQHGGASSSVVDFGSARNALQNLPFQAFVHAIADPHCTVPSASFVHEDFFVAAAAAAASANSGNNNAAKKSRDQSASSIAQRQQQSAVNSKRIVLRFIIHELSFRLEQQQQLGADPFLVETLIEHLRRHVASVSNHSSNITNSNAAASAPTFAHFCHLVVDDARWVQRVLGDPPNDDDDDDFDNGQHREVKNVWRQRFQHWGVDRVKFVMRKAIAYHRAASQQQHVELKRTSGARKKKRKNPAQQQDDDGNRILSEEAASFSVVYQAAVLSSSENDDDDDETKSRAGNTNKTTTAATAKAAATADFEITVTTEEEEVESAAQQVLERWLSVL